MTRLAHALGSGTHFAPDELAPPPLSAITPQLNNYGAAADVRGPLFIIADIDSYYPGLSAAAERGWMRDPRMVPQAESTSVDATTRFRASDAGFRSPPDDPNGIVIYPPMLEVALDFDRDVQVSPFDNAAGRAWGTLRLLNSDGRLDAMAATQNADGRLVWLRIGRKVKDEARGYFQDPYFQDMADLFQGIGTPWFQSEAALELPFRDATYWLERSLQSNVYAGTGTYEGPVGIAGTLKPKVRGGTSSFPVRHVRPLLIDAANLIFQYTDAAGTVVSLFEGGKSGTITFAGDTTNLYSGSTPAGQYRTDNSRGLFQLGSTPVMEITVHCTGAFPSGSTATTVGALAYRLMVEDMLLPPEMVDESSFIGIDAALPLLAGWSWQEDTVGVAAVGLILASGNARMAPTRQGRLKALLLRAPSSYAQPAASYGINEIGAGLRPVPISAPLSPPPYRWRVGSQRNHTALTSGLNVTLSAAELQDLSLEYRQGSGWASTDVQAAYRRPSDPQILQTALLSTDDGDTLAGELGDLWGTYRRRYSLTLPISLGLRHELGDVIALTYPLDTLRSGANAIIVAESFRGGSPSLTFEVLV